METQEIQKIVDEIHSGGFNTLPIDLETIAREEKIEVSRIKPATGFYGRIEFLPDIQRFIIFLPKSEFGVIDSSLAFSFAHELSHYFIPTHRSLLIKGRFHNSKPSYKTKEIIEQEADEFAGRLLIPDNVILPELNKKSYLSLLQIKEIASRCNTSITSTAIRYLKISLQPVVVISSQNGTISWHWSSEDADKAGFGGLGIQFVPQKCSTRRAISSNEYEEGGCDSQLWFSGRKAYAEIWEEALPLGKTGIVLTILSLKVEKEESDIDW